MTKFVLLAAFAVGASLGLTAGIDTLKSARMRAKARLREALHSAEDRVSDPNVIAAVEAAATAGDAERCPSIGTKFPYYSGERDSLDDDQPYDVHWGSG